MGFRRKGASRLLIWKMAVCGSVRPRTVAGV